MTSRTTKGTVTTLTPASHVAAMAMPTPASMMHHLTQTLTVMNLVEVILSIYLIKLEWSQKTKQKPRQKNKNRAYWSENMDKKRK